VVSWFDVQYGRRAVGRSSPGSAPDRPRAHL